MQGLDPLQLISIIELFIATGIALVLSAFIFKKYKEKPKKRIKR